jgi:hypothetical protein
MAWYGCVDKRNAPHKLAGEALKKAGLGAKTRVGKWRHGLIMRVAIGSGDRHIAAVIRGFDGRF